MSRYLKNDRRNKKYEHDELDVTRLSRELIRPKSANYGYRRESNHPDKVGVSLQFMSGHFFKTSEFTVDDIAEALDPSFIQETTLDQENNVKNTKILHFALKGD